MTPHRRSKFTLSIRNNSLIEINSEKYKIEKNGKKSLEHKQKRSLKFSIFHDKPKIQWKQGNLR